MTLSAKLQGSFELAEGWLFRGLHFSLNAGCWTCLLGPSGAGKSTLLRLFAGLGTGGTFTGSIAASDGEPVAGRLAYMAQTDLLFPWADVTENVLVGARLRGEAPDLARAEAVLERVGLAAHRHKFPRELSGGMRQRAGLARTLMEDQPFVLLDEPFSALDARTRAEMHELAFDLLQGKTVLLVTHDPAEAARLGEEIYLLDEDGLQALPLSASPAIRKPEADETLQIQARLFEMLRRR